MKERLETNYIIDWQKGGVVVTFKPTNSQILLNAYDPLNSTAWWWHRGPTDDTGEYSPTAVLETARRLANGAYKVHLSTGAA